MNDSVLRPATAGFSTSDLSGGDPTLSPSPIADDWQAGARDDWRSILDAGRKEGKIVLAADGPPLPGMAGAFKADTGIELDILTERQQGVLPARIDHELGTRDRTIDCYLSGGIAFKFLHQNNLVPIAPQLILPTVTGLQYWSDAKIRWFDDGRKYMLQGVNFVFSFPIVNAKFVNVQSLTSWKDLLKPEFKGKIVIDDPRHPGAGASASCYIVEKFGFDFLKALCSNATFASDPLQLGELVAAGKYPIGLGGFAPVIEPFRKTGSEIVALSFADAPGSVVGGFGVLAEIKGAPNPNAAQVFINWYASKNGQKAYCRASLQASARVDVKVAEVPDYIVPKPGLNYFNQYDQKFYENVKPKLQQQFTDELRK